MKLKIRYETRSRRVEVELTEMEGWLNIEVPDESTIKEREDAVQNKFKIMFNNPDYNNFRRAHRYLDKYREYSEEKGYREEQRMGKGKSKARPAKFVYFKDAAERERACNFVKSIFPKKPEWVDAIIAVYVEGYSIRDYARNIGENENNITQKLKRARKKLKKFFPESSDFWSRNGK